jgi:hypothetical protein
MLQAVEKNPVRVSAQAGTGATHGLQRADWSALALVLVLACFVRVVFFTGALGSDDIIYTEMGVAILHGDWTGWRYAGALRYGINLPVAGFMALFGTSEFTANLWALLCSLGEVAVVFALAHRLWGRRAAVLSALILALLPLHVYHSGRLLADTPLAFFVTLCFALFYLAEERQNRWLHLGSGLALGAVFWIKESVAALVAPLFLAYALWMRTFRPAWLWGVAGAALMLALNIALMAWISGDPLLIFHVASQTMDKLVSGAEIRTSIDFYFRYMFTDARHTWLMPFLAVGGIWVWWRSKPERDRGTGYVVFWALGLLLILSFTVVSLSPLLFIHKQANYMLIFSAPLALLAGYWLASQWKRRWMPVVLFLLVAGSLVLSALEQQVARAFVANSRAALSFQSAHPDVPMYGSNQASNLSSMLSALNGVWPPRPLIRPLMQLTSDRALGATSRSPTKEGGPAAYVILDMETLDWGRGGRMKLDDIPACWARNAVLEPQGFGVGRTVLGALRWSAATLLPDRLAQRALLATDSYYRPRPAYVYSIPVGCTFHLGSLEAPQARSAQHRRREA